MEISCSFQRHRRPIDYFILFASVLLFSSLIYHIFYSIFDHDEIMHLHISFLISQGLAPYRDYMAQHNPLLWYALEPLMKIIHSPFFLVAWARLINLLVLTVSIGSIYYIGREILGRKYSIFAVLLTLSSFTFLRDSIEVRSDPWMNAFVLLSVAFAISGVNKKRFFSFVLSGISMGIAMVALQKATISLFALSLYFLFLLFRPIDGWRRRDICKVYLAVILSASLPVIVFILSLSRAALLSDYYFWNFTFNRFMYLKATLPNNPYYDFSHYKLFLRVFSQNPFIWLAGLLGSIFAVGRVRREKFLAIPLIFVVVHLSLIITSNLAMSHYMLTLIPMLGILSVYLFKRIVIEEKLRDSVLVISVLAMFILCSAIMIFYKKNTDQVAAMDYILSNTSDQDVVFVEPPLNPMYRKTAAFYWFNQDMMIGIREQMGDSFLKPSFDDDLKRWRDFPPKFVYMFDYDRLYKPYHEFIKNYEKTPIEGLLKRPAN